MFMALEWPFIMVRRRGTVSKSVLVANQVVCTDTSGLRHMFDKRAGKTTLIYIPVLHGTGRI